MPPTKKKPIVRRPVIRPIKTAISANVSLLKQDGSQLSATEVQEKVGELELFAFSSGGKFLKSSSIKLNADSKLSLDSNFSGRNIRVLVAPKGLKQVECHPWMGDSAVRKSLLDRKPVYQELKQRNAAELRMKPGQNVDIASIRLDHGIWERWLHPYCKVEGRVVRRLDLDDGNTKDLGLRYGCVYIWEVDPVYRIIQRLPHSDLLRLKDHLKEWAKEKWPDIGPPDPGPLRELRIGNNFRNIISAPALVNAASVRLSTEEAVAYTAVASAESENELRAAFMQHTSILEDTIRHWDFGMFRYKKQWVGCACIDEMGYFETRIARPADGDKPDLYFQVRQYSGPSARIVYESKIPKTVHWNYRCGSDILLVTTDVGAVYTEPSIDYDTDEPTYVSAHGIGHFNLSQINDNYLLDAGIVSVGSPLAKTISLKCNHSTNIPTNDIYGFRLKYRKSGTEHWLPFTAAVTRHYEHIYKVDEVTGTPVPLNSADGQMKVTYPTARLGPISIPGDDPIYRFRPAEVGDLVSEATNNSYNTYNWPAECISNESYLGFLDTTALPKDEGAPEDEATYGDYDIKLEVVDSSGGVVAPSAGTFQFIVPTSPDVTDVPTTTETVVPGANDGNGLIFTIHVDNRPCVAEIDAPSVNGTLAGDLCGVLNYQNTQSDVDISFEASHPGNHATFGFDLKRGNILLDGVPNPSDPGPEIDACDNGIVGQDGANYDLIGPSYVGLFKVDDIIGPCDNAAYAEHLHVYATAHNGHDRIHEYNAHALRAFALMKGKPHGGPPE